MKILKRDPATGYLDGMLWVPKTAINVNAVKSALTIQSGERGTLQFFSMWRETKDHLLVPREFWDAADFDFPVVDCRPDEYRRTRVKSRIVLDARAPHETVQRDAFNAIMACRGGILQLACGRGKTVITLEVIAKMHTPALVIVDNTQLMSQWLEAIDNFLEVPGGVGRIQATTMDWKKPIVVATYTTLANIADNLSAEVRNWFGLIVWDEAHHMAAPTWSRTADLFPGKRLALTATPTRTDGLHVIYESHVGKVIHKDLTQDLKPSFEFHWTGFAIDVNDPQIRDKTHDVTGEIHLSKVQTYLGSYRPRLEKIIQEVRKARKEGRRVLVLSKSVDEIVNLLALWCGREKLITELPMPTPETFSDPGPMQELTPTDKSRIEKTLAIARATLVKAPTANTSIRIAQLEERLRAHHRATAFEKARMKVFTTYIKDLLKVDTDAGVMTARVAVDVRTRMLREKPVMFVVAKYGREGLDEDRLDTIIVSNPMSDRGALQQVMGRIQRSKAGKKSPKVIFLEDNIPPYMGMCRKIRRFLREWPKEEGGPFSFTLHGHPGTRMSPGAKHNLYPTFGR